MPFKVIGGSDPGKLSIRESEKVMVPLDLFIVTPWQATGKYGKDTPVQPQVPVSDDVANTKFIKPDPISLVKKLEIILRALA